MAAILVVMTGVPGTGKSAIADALAGELRAPVLSVDVVEAALNRRGITREHGDGSHHAAYELLAAFAETEIAAERSVILDAMHAEYAWRDHLRHVAGRHGAPTVVLATTCSDRAVHRSRLEGRVRDLPGFLYQATWTAVEPHLDGYRDPADADLLLDSVDPLTDNIRRALVLIRSRLADDDRDGHA